MLPVFYERRPENLFVGTICDHPFPCHVHDVTEIVCLTQGQVEMTIAGESYTLNPGDLIMIFSSFPHSYDYVSSDAAGLTLIFTADAIPEYKHTLRSMRPATPHMAAKDVPEELLPVIRKLMSLPQDDHTPLQLAYLHLFLAHLFMHAQLQPVDRNLLTGVTSQALNYVGEHFTEPVSLESTARALGISRIHLSHIFSQQLKINFRQYVNSLRIDMACSLLRNPENSVSQVAWQCGYGNLRTFHRAFLTQVGSPPNQWRRRVLGNQVELPDEPDADDTTF